MAWPGNLGQQWDVGSQMWMDFMKQIQGIQQGKTTPQELPMFKELQAYINKIGQTQDQNLMRELIARGITGGALEQAMRQSQEQRQMGLMNAINQMYSQAGGMIPQVGQQGMQNFMKMFYEPVAARKKEHDYYHAMKRMQQSQFTMQGGMEGIKMIAGGIAGGMGGGGMGGAMAGMGGGGGQTYQTTPINPPSPSQSSQTPEPNWSEWMQRMQQLQYRPY